MSTELTLPLEKKIMENKKIFDIKRLWEIKILGIPQIYFLAFTAFSNLIGYLLYKIFA